MTRKDPRIFISSTFDVGAEFGDVVLSAVVRAGLVPVKYETDIPTVSGSVAEQIKSEIDRSDAFLLIVGLSYGALYPQTRLSAVEVEYEEAKRSKKPILVFLRQEDAAWRRRHVDSEQERLQQFRQRLASDLVVRTFSNRHQLGSALLEALGQFVVALNRSRQVKIAKLKVDKPLTTVTCQVKIVKLLLSSPGDVRRERDRVQNAVFKFNQESVAESGLFVQLVRWEDMAPQIGPGAQGVISKQIGSYHLFCGIMWNRFGTPTAIGASGTKEEFDSAIGRWETDGRPWVTFYFCKRPAKFDTQEQLDQRRQVLDFRTQLNSMGIVREYLTTQEFEDKLLVDMRRIARDPAFLALLGDDK